MSKNLQDLQIDSLSIFHRDIEEAYDCTLDLLTLNFSNVNVICAESESLFLSIINRYKDKFTYHYLSEIGAGNRLDFDAFSAIAHAQKSLSLSISQTTNLFKEIIENINKEAQKPIPLSGPLYQYFVSSFIETINNKGKSENIIEAWAQIVEEGEISERLNQKEKDKILRIITSLKEGHFISFFKDKQLSFEKFIKNNDKPNLVFINCNKINDLGSYLLSTCVLLYLNMNSQVKIYDLISGNTISQVTLQFSKTLSLDHVHLYTYIQKSTEVLFSPNSIIGIIEDINDSGINNIIGGITSGKSKYSFTESLKYYKPNEFNFTVRGTPSYTKVISSRTYKIHEDSNQIIFDLLRDKNKPWIKWIPTYTLLKHVFNDTANDVNYLNKRLKRSPKTKVIFKKLITHLDKTSDLMEEITNQLSRYPCPSCNSGTLDFLKNPIPKCSNCKKPCRLDDIICPNCKDDILVSAEVLGVQSLYCKTCNHTQ